MKYKEPLIYAYKRKSLDKIVYIGQTIDLTTRHKSHIKYDPYNPNKIEYNYPLSRGVRKHGQDEYELIILEDKILVDELNDKEKYYIAKYNTYYDGYNQNAGGGINENFYIYEESKIKQAYDLLENSKLTFPQMSEDIGLSITHLYNLNYGLRRRQDNINYPLRNEEYLTRGQKLTINEVKQIKELLKSKKISIKEIEKIYKSKSITGINSGKVFYDENEDYPLRNKYGIKGQKLKYLIEELYNSKISFKDLGEKYEINQRTVSKVNKGLILKIENTDYPIRNI